LSLKVMMALTVLDPGLLTTVQDLGRTGCQHLGVPVSGAMDRFAMVAANRLVGNPPAAAGLEALWLGPALRTESDCLVAAAGAGFTLEVDGRSFPLWLAVYVRRGQVLRLVAGEPGGIPGCWGYLTVAGGLDVPQVLGSRATYLRGGFGGIKGRPLQVGDVLPFGGPPPGELAAGAGRSLVAAYRPAYGERPTLEVILGPQAGAFTPGGLAAFLEGEYAVSLVSDRMGYRLEGPPIEHGSPADILSEPVALGAVQVPADGQPLVLLADRQTAGGYTKIATVVSADLPVLVQSPPGEGRLHFRTTSLEAAQSRWLSLVNGLEAGIEEG
jgi:antagonist of KipI